MAKRFVFMFLLLSSLITFAFGLRPVKSVAASPLIIRVPHDYSTIQEALNVANSGDTIVVSAGTYYENVTVNKSVSLLGESRKTTIIDCEGECMLVTSTNVRISGFTIQNGAWGIYLNHSSGSVIFENAFMMNGFAGVGLEDSSGNMIINNEAINNGGGVPGLEFGVGIGLLNSNSNIISGNLVSINVAGGIEIASSYGNIVNHNTVTSNPGGVHLFECSGNTVRDNVMISNGGGVALTGTSGNTIENNQVFRNEGGIGLGYSKVDIIKENNITENTVYGIALAETSINITVVGNNISNNYCGILVHYSNGSFIHHNNFVNNTKNAPEDVYPNINTWDDGYPSGGNYWSDYNGTDLYSGPHQNETGSDGIGDTQHTLDPRNQDKFPLMAPISFFHVGAWNKTPCEIHLISNSTITNFQLNKTEKKISFNVTGPDTIIGFCRITIPNIIIQEMWNNNYTILIDETPPLTTSNWTDDTYTYIYFAYIHSEHEVKILPEFPPAIILLLLVTITLRAIGHRKEKKSLSQK